MDLISLVVMLAIVGLIVWLVLRLVPMPAEFAMAIKVVAGLALLLWLLQHLPLPSLRIGG